MIDLGGQIAVVTGAGHRLGEALALGLAEAGADVVVHVNRSVAGGEETVAAIAALGGRATLVQANLSDPAELERFAREGAQRLGQPTIAVLSAANFVRARLAETDAATWDEVFDLNLRAPVLLASRLGAAMQAAGGRIVLIGDAAGTNLWPGYAAHSLAKHALHAAVPLLAAELAPAVTVNAIAPGPVLPPAGSDAAQLDAAVAQTLLRRCGSPDDVLAALLYLVGPGSYVSGAVIPVDGGRHVRGMPRANG